MGLKLVQSIVSVKTRTSYIRSNILFKPCFYSPSRRVFGVAACDSDFWSPHLLRGREIFDCLFLRKVRTLAYFTAPPLAKAFEFACNTPRTDSAARLT